MPPRFREILAFLPPELGLHLFGVVVDLARLLDAVELFEALEALADGAEVRQRAAEPALGDVVHADVGDVLLDDAAGLPLGSDEQHVLALRDGLGQKLASQQEPLDGLLDVDDVDLVALAINVRRHLRVPVRGTVSEVDAGFDKVFHERRHVASAPASSQSLPAERSISAGDRIAHEHFILTPPTRPASHRSTTPGPSHQNRPGCRLTFSSRQDAKLPRHQDARKEKG